jgi:uroporphyrin-3 C-methyltransferase
LRFSIRRHEVDFHTLRRIPNHSEMSVEPQGPGPTPQSGPTMPARISRRRRLADWLSRNMDMRTIAIVIGLALIVVFWFDSRNRVNDLQQQLVAKLAEADGYNKESRQVATQARDTLRDVEFKVGMLESRLAETQNQRLALEALYLELSRSRDERVLAEVEQILLLGSQQLQLAGNLKAALLALETADARLQRADSPQFTSLRRSIRRDIDRLKAAPYVDVVGMSLRLDNLTHQVDGLQLAMYERPAEPKPVAPNTDEGAVQRLAREAWDDLKSLVRVQRIESNEVPLLSPSQQFFLRENLRMRMLSARISLLAHDEAGFKADTRSAADWLQRYFDMKDKRVAAAVAALKQLSESEVSIDLPDVSASLEAVRNQKLVRERGLR